MSYALSCIISFPLEGLLNKYITVGLCESNVGLCESNVAEAIYNVMSLWH